MRPLALFVALALSACSGLPLADGDAAVSDASADLTPLDATAVTADDSVPVAEGVASWLLPRPGLDGARRTAFLFPWPSDVSRTAAGRADLTYLPGLDTPTILAQYITQFTDRLDGFSTVGGAYLRFGSAIDPTSLPTSVADTVREGATVQLLDVDPASPEHGRRVPAQLYLRGAATRYWHTNTLAVGPATGFPLRPHTKYAIVVTTDLRRFDGRPFARDRDLDAVLGEATASDDAAVTNARRVFGPSITELEGLGIPRARILSFTVFTTIDPGAEFFRAADWLRRAGPEPRVVDSTAATYTGTFYRINGHYGPNAEFQAGDPPYGMMGSGRFVLDATGTPTVQRTENIRFALTIPSGPMPERGWPLAIYAHGTGGDYASFIDDRTAAAAASEGVAMLGFDQVFHGERATPGTSPETAFFNFLNPEAGRTNNLQQALDLVQLGRLAPTLSFAMTRTNGERTTARFDTSRLMFFGHSQGGLNGPLWFAADDTPRAGVFSGAGGAFNVSLLAKTQPVNIPVIVRSLLNLEPTELVPLHPAITLLQLLIDPADPVNYGRYIQREPREGVRPKHVFMTQGFVDTYAPPEGIAALARSIRLPLVAPTPHPDALFPLTGVAAAMLPAYNNVVLAGGATVTGAWMQFDAPTGRDGHFVAFSVPGARLRAAGFLGSAATDVMGAPTVRETVP